MFAAGGGSTPDNGKTYIEDVFSTYLYTGNGSTQYINNGIQLGDGTVNGTTFHLTGDALTDSSGYSHTITKVGTISVSTSQKKYGDGSLASTSGSNCLYTSSTIAGNLDSSDFTIEFWIYFNSWVQSNHVLSGHTSDGDSNKPWTFYTLSTGWAFYASSPANPTGWDVVSGLSLGSTFTNQWKHIAITRSGNTFRSFVNGVQQATATSSLSLTSSNGVSVFSTLTRTEALNGYIDDLRIIKGKALYTSDFTPPTAALPLDTFVTGKGGMVWIKQRTAAEYHYLTDTTGQPYQALCTNTTDAKSGGSGQGVTAFNQNGFSLTYGGGWGYNVNSSGSSIASWTFRKAPKFFDVVTYTGNNAARIINHSLGQAPGIIMIKATSSTSDWFVYHRSVGATKSLYLNQTYAESGASGEFWNNTEPTSTNFSLGGFWGLNSGGVTYVAYLFAHDTTTDGLIQCGSYTGNGSATAGTEVNLGWEPQYVLIKLTSDSGENWQIYDVMRGMPVVSTDSANTHPLFANTSNSELNGYSISPTSTGFRCNTTHVSVNGSGKTYIYMAIRRGPMRTPTDGTKVFKPIVYTGASAQQTVTTGFPVDLNLGRGLRTDTKRIQFIDRLRGSFTNTYTTLSSAAADAEVTGTGYGVGLDSNAEYVDNLYAKLNSGSLISWNFQRAPGFFDVVCYTGDGNYRAINHNLGVTPELVIIKRRTNITSPNQGWIVTGTALGVYNNTNPSILYLNNTDPKNYRGGSDATGLLSYFTGTSGYNSFTSTIFNVGNGGETNASGEKFVAYLFASCPGVSKVGSFTGNGSTQTIDCGFSGGARFVLIKRTDSTGDWYVWDTARGIVAATDPHLSLNTTAAEVTSDDTIDPDSTGFIVNQVADTNVNVNNASYIYLAIA